MRHARHSQWYLGLWLGGPTAYGVAVRSAVNA